MSVEFYYAVGSPFCRSVQMAATAIGVELILKEVNTRGGEHLTPKYLAMNPQHLVPTIKDGDFVLWESRAIMGYLVNKYGKDDKLYPKDPVKRAVVDQRLYFDAGTLYQRFADYYYPQIMYKKPAEPEKYKRVEEALEFFNTFLEGQKYAAGNDLTIADLALLASLSTYVDGGANLPLDGYPNVQRWYEDCKKNAPGYQSTVAGLEFVRLNYFTEKE